MVRCGIAWSGIVAFLVELPLVLVVVVMVLGFLLLLLLLLLLLHEDLLLAELCDAVLDDAQVSHDIVLAGRQLVGVLETRLCLQQATTLHVDDA